MTTRGRGVVRLWTKTCSDYDPNGHASEVLYQTVHEGKVFEIRATPEQVVFFQSPRRQVRAPSAAVLEAVTSQWAAEGQNAPSGAPVPGAAGAGMTLEEVLDAHILGVDKPESVKRFNLLTAIFEQRPPRPVRPDASAGEPA